MQRPLVQPNASGTHIGQIRRNSHEIRTNFCEFFEKVSKHAQLHKGHTLQSHRQQMDQAPARPGTRALGAAPREGGVPQVPQRGGPDGGGGDARDGEVNRLTLVDRAVLGDLQLVHQPGEKEHQVLGHLQHGHDVGRGRAGEEGGVVGARGGAG